MTEYLIFDKSDEILTELADRRGAVRISRDSADGFWYVDAIDGNGGYSESYYARTLFGALDGLFRLVKENDHA